MSVDQRTSFFGTGAMTVGAVMFAFALTKSPSPMIVCLMGFLFGVFGFLAMAHLNLFSVNRKRKVILAAGWLLLSVVSVYACWPPIAAILELDKVSIPDQQLVLGQPLFINVSLRARDAKVYDVAYAHRVLVIGRESESESAEAFEKKVSYNVKSALTEGRQNVEFLWSQSSPKTDIPAHQSGFATIPQMLSWQQGSGLVTGATRLYVLAIWGWKDENGKSKIDHECRMLRPIVSFNIQESAITWQTCQI
jgi:hypothetical protein